jgi:hypothetical protein
MHRDTTAYGQGQREVWFGSVEWAEAAARDFQHRGYRRRTRGLVPGDVLVAETAEGFSLFWIPQDQCAPPSPARGECVWEKGPGDEGPGEAGSSQFTPRPLAGPWMGSNRPGVRASGPGGGPTETALVKLGAVLGS